MQRLLARKTLPSVATLVIVSLVVGFFVTFTLASIPLTFMPISPDQWWMWCWAGFGGWYGFTMQLLRTPRIRFISLPLAGALAFAVAQIVTVTLFDGTSIQLPYYLAPVVPNALFGGMALMIFSRFVREPARSWRFLLFGCLGFGIGGAIDFGIRNAILIPNFALLNTFTIALLKLIAITCFSACVGVSLYLAVQRHDPASRILSER